MRTGTLTWHWQSPDLKTVLLVLIFHPLVEELAFRGAIQEALLRRLPVGFGPLSFANLVTSLLFAAMHLGSRAAWLAIATFIPSLVFGYFRERHGSLLSPIVLHMVYNGMALLLLPLP
ncbi:JDVT-CTERM system glutamic-type intramembrane protease MrtJ [Stagnimonas aquatica]|uniref:JDVT-CTERM system glutamic-type intramembrane protease MrtJ n=1 Tax=Stagnimonas aquatica TaxID=2689987 RepID=UPI00131565C5|nr:JDVT-CTERM system glutamic-type intramembrane protease [Stagnimonas aquatica]